MLKAIKKQFSVQWKEWGGLTLVIAGAWILGMILCYVLMRTDDEVTSYFPLGTLMAILAAVVCVGLTGCLWLGYYFNLEVSMGCTRKEFFVSNFMVSVVFAVFYTGIIVLMNLAERVLQRQIYSGLKGGSDFLPYLLKWGIPAAAAICMLSSLAGAAILRYGKKILWVFWFVWVIGVLVIPQIQNAMEEAPDSLFGKIGRAVGDAFCGVSVSTLIVFLGIGSAAGLGISWLLLRKQQVTS